MTPETLDLLLQVLGQSPTLGFAFLVYQELRALRAEVRETLSRLVDAALDEPTRP